MFVGNVAEHLLSSPIDNVAFCQQVQQENVVVTGLPRFLSQSCRTYKAMFDVYPSV